MVLAKWSKHWLAIVLNLGFWLPMVYLLATKSDGGWQRVDRDTAIQVLAQNSKNLAETKDLTRILSDMRSTQLKPSNAPALVIYDFNTPRLCGVGGCLHSIYDKDRNKMLFRVLLNKDRKITTDDNCLAVQQSSQKGNVNLKYCFQNSKYVEQAIYTTN